MDEENNEYGIAGWLTAEQVEQLYSLQDELYRDDTDTYNIFCAVLAKAKELGKGLMAINGIRFNAEIEGDPTRDYPYRYRLYETFYTGKYNDAKINLRLIELLNVL
jgi:hypothetical protein